MTMSGITDPGEEYFKDGLWAWDPAGTKWLKLIIDPLTNQLSVAVNNDAEIHQTTPADLRTGAHGWDGAAWHKLPMVFGYSDRWAENAEGAATGAGNAVAVTAAVPAGYVYVLQQAEAFHDAAAAVELLVTPIAGALVCGLVHELAAAAWVHYSWTGSLVLKAGDQIAATAAAPGDGKKVHLHTWGYKMKVAE